ncbi:type I restriction endonuclease [Calditerricola satsumensis]|uniref:Type I restriction endonuclease subunit R n=1 Tax=Calditerricola satsumensis TaxID=373054 RepID=A0A8J3B462_9BACI|nr:type I restriction endonuclease [Calditerricola satsumensis]GGJ94421.1 type I restriction endonuclease subunit R [Calditerricola satsumensis]
MTPDISERSFEEAIEAALLGHGSSDSLMREAPASYGVAYPGGYHRRRPEDYDRTLCLIPRDVLDFIVATQPKEWARLKQHYGSAVEEKFLKRLASEIERRGTLDVLRHGIKDMGSKFRLAYFRPASGLNEETRRLYEANIFSVVRQLRYSTRNEKSLDLVLFLNGLPIFTAELKNPLTGQTVEDAMRQYRQDRDPREPLFSYGRCLAHFAVDPELVYVTTHLQGAKTRFLPFNQGRFGGAGNPPVPPTQPGYATSYLWEETWAPDSVLDLIRNFIHEVEEEDENGRKTGRRFLIFPRYHQLDCVRKLIAHAREHGPGQSYLIQHSAGSGKTYTIAWLAHQLATLHDANDRRIFDSVIVITDRKVLDRQLQRAMRQFEQTLGVVENIDTTSRQLKEALEVGKTIIVTTLQKFPVIVNQISELPARRFAVIIDEARSSQTGENARSLRAVLAAGSLEEAEREEADTDTPQEAFEKTIHREIERRGRLPNVSMFAFTATPKPKTLEMFGTRRPDGKYEPFHRYTMRQAIEEGFIMDVLANYTTYKAYWRLLKTIEDDPRYDKRKTQHLLKTFVELHPHAINEKVKIMVEHFATQVQHEIGGKAKAMVVTRSRLHAVRYKLAFDRYLDEQGYPFKALVAFSGTVQDGGRTYTESDMNGFPESQTAKMFERPEYRFLIVADKFQTGFDQPLLHTMYVDKKLGGVNAVQTLSRLNRTHPEKRSTMVLDFVNEADEIKAAFEPYYEVTLLSEGTDPNLLYEIQSRLTAFAVFTDADVDAFAKVYFDKKATMDKLYAVLAPVEERFRELPKEEQHDFRGQLTDFIRLYAFLSQIIPFADPDLEKLYVFARYLLRKLQIDRDTLPWDVQQYIDMESYRIQKTSSGRITLERKAGALEPQRTKGRHAPAPEELEPLSRIIAELNERFGINLGPEHRVTLDQVMAKLDADPALDASVRVNTRENARLTFDHKVEQVLQEIVDLNFELYKRITDDPAFGEAIKNMLFDHYVRAHRQADELLKRPPSKTLAFLPALFTDEPMDGADTFSVGTDVLATIAAFLNTEGGDLLLGVAADGTPVGIEQEDGYVDEDDYLQRLVHAVRKGLGEQAAACVDARIQMVRGKMVCLVSCRRSSTPVFVQSGSEASARGDFYVRQGSETVRLSAEDAEAYIRSRFPQSAADRASGSLGE